ncbi:hypothetical protein Bca4012_005245 [Brassica carinata]
MARRQKWSERGEAHWYCFSGFGRPDGGKLMGDMLLRDAKLTAIKSSISDPSQGKDRVMATIQIDKDLQEALISLSKMRDVESYTPICLEDSFDSLLLPSQALYRGDGKTMSFGGSVDAVTT